MQKHESCLLAWYLLFTKADLNALPFNPLNNSLRRVILSLTHSTQIGRHLCCPNPYVLEVTSYTSPALPALCRGCLLSLRFSIHVGKESHTLNLIPFPRHRRADHMSISICLWSVMF